MKASTDPQPFDFTDAASVSVFEEFLARVRDEEAQPAGPLPLSKFPEIEARIASIKDEAGDLRQGWLGRFLAPHSEWDQILALPPIQVPEDVMLLDSLIRATRNPVAPTPAQRVEQVRIRRQIVSLATKVEKRRVIVGWLLDRKSRSASRTAPTARKRSAGRAPRRAPRRGVRRIARAGPDEGPAAPEPPRRASAGGAP